jgi:hypothetical protein
MPDKRQRNEQPTTKITMPSAEEVQRALANVENFCHRFSDCAVALGLCGLVHATTKDVSVRLSFLCKSLPPG